MCVSPQLPVSIKLITDEVAELDINTQRRPFQGELGYLTLWPETEKIFGHGYEVELCSQPILFDSVTSS